MKSISTTSSFGDEKPKSSISRETTVTVDDTAMSKTVEEVGGNQLALLYQPIRYASNAPAQIYSKATFNTAAVRVERRGADILDHEFPPKTRWSRMRWSTVEKAVEWGWDNDELLLDSQSGKSIVMADDISPADAVEASVPVLRQTQSGNPTASSLGLTTYGPTITTGASQPDKSTALDEYEIIYLCTGEHCCSAAELCLGLGTSALFKMHDVVATLPVKDNIWEVLMPTRHVLSFSNCAENFGFTTEQRSTPEPGLCTRTLLVWLYSGENYFVPLVYINFLKSRPFLDVFKDLFRAQILLPKSFVIWFKPYRRIGPCYTVGE